MRLVGGSHYREGTVEVCRHQQWGRVCDDEWGVEDSAVVCRQLGLANEGEHSIYLALSLHVNMRRPREKGPM